MAWRNLAVGCALLCLACGGSDAEAGASPSPDGGAGGSPAGGGAAGSAGVSSAGSGGGGSPASGGSAGQGGAAGSAVGGGAGFYPKADWPEGDPVAAGLDVAELDAASAYAESVNSRCLLVIRHGKLVYERYFNGADAQTLHPSWSIAKSFTSALVGVALLRGEIQSVDEPVENYVPEWQGTEEGKLTLRHLLGMVPGLEFDLIQDNIFTVLNQNFTKKALSRKVTRPPGTVYEYSNLTVQLFEPILKAATGRDVEDYAREQLWDPMGFGKDTHWQRDPSGNPAPFMGVHATCRDYARLGYLYLWKGNWDGTQLIQPAHVEASRKPDFAPNHAHSNYWWLNGQMPAQSATGGPKDSMLFPEAPSDMISALGLGQNFVDIVPSRDTIYVHMRPADIVDPQKWISDLPGMLQALTDDGELNEHRQLWTHLWPAG